MLHVESRASRQDRDLRLELLSLAQQGLVASLEFGRGFRLERFDLSERGLTRLGLYGDALAIEECHACRGEDRRRRLRGNGDRD